MTKKHRITEHIISYFKRSVTPLHFTSEDGIRYWQDKISLNILFFTVFLGAITIVPSLLMSFIVGERLIAVSSGAIYGYALLNFFKRSWPYQVRAMSIVILFYIIGMIVTLAVGPFGAGLIFIFAFPILTGILLGIRHSLVALGINLLSLIVLGLLIYAGLMEWSTYSPYPPLVWLVIGVNFYLLNIITTVSTTFILRGLQNSLDKEIEMFKSLEAKHQLLNESNSQLKNEIAERKKAQFDLFKSEEKYRTLVTQMNEGVIITDVNSQITYINPKVSAISAYPEDSLLGNTVDKLFDEENRQIVMEYASAADKAVANSFEVSLITKQGKRVPLLISGSIITDGNSFFGFILVLTDIARLKEVENKLKLHQEELENRIKQRTKELETAKKEAERANQSKSAFLANISHELRTPMHAILGFGKLGRAKVGKISIAKIRDYFSEVVNSAQRLLYLLNDLLDLSKIEAGKLVYDFQVQKISDVTSIAINELAILISEKGITVEFDPPASADLAMIDKERIIQVIKNLLSNAVKFSPQQSKILIDIRQKEDKVIFAVTDYGIGIPENELESVFDEFIQSSKSKAGKGGTGLGLSICRKIITDHQGTIWAESNPEDGTSFRFMLPSVQT